MDIALLSPKENEIKANLIGPSKCDVTSVEDVLPITKVWLACRDIMENRHAANSNGSEKEMDLKVELDLATV